MAQDNALDDPGRRRFLKVSAALGGGLVIGFHLPGTLTGMMRSAAAQAADKPPIYPPNAFIRIALEQAAGGVRAGRAGL